MISVTETNRILTSRDVKFVNEIYYNNKDLQEYEPVTDHEETDKDGVVIDPYYKVNE